MPFRMELDDAVEEDGAGNWRSAKAVFLRATRDHRRAGMIMPIRNV